MRINLLKILNDFYQEIYIYRYVLIQLIKQELILRYRRTFLGYAWNLINPLLIMSITIFVFSSIYKVDIKNFAIYLFSGTIAFNIFSQSITKSASALIQNQNLLTKVYVPKIIFPLSYFLSILIDNILMGISLFIIMLIIGSKISLALLFLPISYLMITIFAFGFNLWISIFSVYFRDLQHIITILMQAFLFLSPVFIKPSFLSGKVKLIYDINPLTYFINLFRRPLLESNLPDLSEIFLCLFLGIFSLNIGIFIFNKYKNKIVFML